MTKHHLRKKQGSRHQTDGDSSKAKQILICILLVATTLIVYWQVQGHEFLSFDDYIYVTENTHVTTKLTSENIIWAFTGYHAANWHPVTWLSHMLDYQLYGLNPKGHHLTNLFFHIANSLLLFIVLLRMTGALWQSCFVAAMFALHPLHVESVAWVARGYRYFILTQKMPCPPGRGWYVGLC